MRLNLNVFKMADIQKLNVNSTTYDISTTWEKVTGKPSTFTPSSHTHTKSQITDFPSSMPASDVYSWAKAASKPSYNFGEIGAGVATIGDGANRLMFRTNGSYASGMYYSTPGNEAHVFANVNSVTSWIFATTNPTSQTAWTSLIPSMQIKNGRVVINKLIGNDTNASYNLDVNGSANATTLYEGGTRVSLAGHTHTKSQITDFPSSMPASDVYSWAKAATKPSYTFSEITSKPTTLAGYGISDAFFLLTNSTYLGVRFANGEYATGDKYLEWWNGAGWVNHMSAKYIVAGGTSSHFLKGDGSLDGTGYLPLSGGTISGSNVIGMSSAGLPTIGGSNIATKSMAIGVNGIGISGIDTRNDGAAIFLENNGTEANRLIIALGDDSVQNGSQDYTAFRYYDTAGAVTYESKIPFKSGTLAIHGDPQPASDVYSWAKAASKPSYTYSEVGAAPASHSHNYTPIAAYSYTSGCLVKTDIQANSYSMVYFKIEGNSYYTDSIFTTGCFYVYEQNALLSQGGVHHGYNFGDICVYIINGYIYLWFKQQSSYQTFLVTVYTQNSSPIYNRVESISNSSKPTSYTNTLTISPRIKFNPNDHGHASLTTTSIGSATNPIYWDANGKPAACTYSLNKTVPADAVFTDTNTTYSAGTGLSLSGTTFSVSYGTTAGTSCQGNDNRLSNARPASDVYAWAKAASKPSYNFGEIGAGVATIGDGANRLMFRTNGSYASGMYYSTPGNEAHVFANVNSATSWIFATTNPTSQTAWTSLTPSMQIKNGRVVINKLIGNDTNASYNLDVNGSANATTLYEGGTRVSLAGHTHTKSQITDFSHSHDYLPLTGGTMTGSITMSQPSSNRRVGIVGTYDPDRAAAIWSMGSSYQIATDGLSFGSLYGAAYAYYGSGYTFGAGKSGGHSFVWCQEGSPTSALGNNVWTSGGFIKNGSNDNYVLLGGGGHKAESSLSVNYANSAGSVAWGNVTGKPSTFAPSSHTHNYLPLSGGTMSGQLFIQYAKKGLTSIVKDSSSLIIGNVTSTSGFNGYHAGIGFNALCYSPYTDHTHAWIGLGPYTTTASAECYPLVFATNGSTTTGTSPTVRMTIAPDGKITMTNTCTAAGFYQDSDERLKTFHDPIKVDLEKLKTLRKNYFKFNDNDKLEIGVSAQEIQKLYPEIVSTNDEGYLSVAYDKLSVIALSAIDKLDDDIKDLRQENNDLKDQLKAIKNILKEKGIL